MKRNSSEQKQEKEGNDHHVVTISEVNKDRLASMEQNILAKPKLLHNFAGQSSCSIFRVPPRLVEINGNAYRPYIVSIGPYHYGEEHLKMIQEHKWRFLGSLVSRTQSKGLGLEDYLKAIKPLEEKTRLCYSQTIALDHDEFVEMMVLDGCFIIELFRKVWSLGKRKKLVPVDPNDPLFTNSWVFTFLSRDLLKLENQVPFFVLQSLFDLSTIEEEEKGPSLPTLALKFFNYFLQRTEEVIERHHSLTGKHLLDLLRLSFIPLVEEDPKKNKGRLRGLLIGRKKEDPKKANSSPPVIQCVAKLRQAGISFKPPPEKADSFLDIKFRGGVLQMPTITMDDFTSSFLLNCVAFEQSQKHCSKHITDYTTFMDCLIDTPKDVGILCDKNIIENYFGTDGEVARLFNNLGKDVAFDISECYLSKLFEEVNQYYQNGWHVQWAGFRYTYFRTPWSFISALAAVILLILTLLQTFFTVYPYVHPHGH